MNATPRSPAAGNTSMQAGAALHGSQAGSARGAAGLHRYDAIAMALHWLIALAVLAQIALGFWMLDIPKTPPGARAAWFNVHKSIGLSIGLLVLLRLTWRVLHAPPALPSSVGRLQAAAARATHVALYACMLTMPVAGYLGSVFSGYPILVFGTPLPMWGWKSVALKDFFSALHGATALVFIALIALHAAPALKHLLVDRDGVFHRMLPQRFHRPEVP